jgi:hypothetical protein
VKQCRQVQILCFWTLSIVLSLYKNIVLFLQLLQNSILETGFCLCLQVKPTQLGPIARASPYLRTPVSAPRWGIQAKHNTNPYPRAKKHQIIKNFAHNEASHQKTIKILVEVIVTGIPSYHSPNVARLSLLYSFIWLSSYNFGHSFSEPYRIGLTYTFHKMGTSSNFSKFVSASEFLSSYERF